MNKTSIEYLTHTWNPTTGCIPASEGCAHCWAAAMHKRHLWGDHLFGEIQMHGDRIAEPLRRQKPASIGVSFMGDLYHHSVRTDFIQSVVGIVYYCQHHLFFMLTKRPQAMLSIFKNRTIEDCTNFTYEYFTDDEFPEKRLEKHAAHKSQWPLNNLYLGVSIENQRAADDRRLYMAELAAMGFNIWVSYEPALGVVKWDGWEFIRFMAAGGESGPGARAAHPECFRFARDFCQKINARYCFKSWGEWIPTEYTYAQMYGANSNRNEIYIDHMGKASKGLLADAIHFEDTPNVLMMLRVGKKAAGRMLDGREWLEFPDINKELHRLPRVSQGSSLGVLP